MENLKPKPLTDAERRQIQSYLQPAGAVAVGSAVDLLYKLLAAEQYWREAVKNAKPYESHHDQGGDWKSCIFCDGGWGPQHKPNCPWLLAQPEDSNGK